MSALETTQPLSSRVRFMRDIEWKKLQVLQQDTFKDLPKPAKDKLKTSLLKNSFSQPLYVWEDPAHGALWCLDGRHRMLILEELEREGHEVPAYLPAVFIHCDDKRHAASLVLIFSSAYAKVSSEGLLDFINLHELNYDDLKDTIDIPELDLPQFETLLTPDTGGGGQSFVSLSDRFGVPPFSVFDTRQGYWQERKKKWHTFGINSQETREDVDLIADSGQPPAVYQLRNEMRVELGREPSWPEILEQAKAKGMHVYSGASIFDPVLCEIAYKWFCPSQGSIIDPFAGGSVRGIVAGVLDYDYIGIDLRPEQVQANADQWKTLKDREGYGSAVTWLIGDSSDVLPGIQEQYDFLFSCPPYHDLEKYSEDPRDLSNMPYSDFLNKYRAIIFHSVARLKDDRFACFVVSDIRDKAGFYRDFVGDTVAAFQDAGMQLYNEIILLNVAGSLPIRVGRQFQNYRKVGRTHQNILVFYKGDPKKIPGNFPTIEVDDINVGDLPQDVEPL